MNKLLLLLLLTLSITSVIGQDVNIFKSLNAKKNTVYMMNDLDVKYIVKVEGKTAIEIYNMVEIAIAKQWINPDEVILGKSFGKYIKVSGGAPMIEFSTLGTSIYFYTRLNYMFQFKDGRFMYTVNSKMKAKDIDYSTVSLGLTDFYLTVIKTYKKNGKPIKLGLESVKSINNSVNLFISLILESNIDGEFNLDW